MSRHTQLNFDTASFKEVHKHYGKSFYAGTLFFPKDIREATYALYTFLRIPDEIVDDKTNEGDVVSKLAEWKENWKLAYENRSSSDKKLNKIAFYFNTYHITFEESQIFLDAMTSDVDTNRYPTYESLTKYMYGSAGIVGVMMTKIIGLDKKDRHSKNEDAWTTVFEYAVALGEAFQMTNFLRDIKEDIDERGRIYIPTEDMEQFGVTEDDIKNHTVNENFINLMKFEIERTRALYRKAEQGISLLHPSCQRAIKIASNIYEKILDKIEKNKYDVYQKRARTNTFEKIKIALLTK